MVTTQVTLPLGWQLMIFAQQTERPFCWIRFRDFETAYAYYADFIRREGVYAEIKAIPWNFNNREFVSVN